MFTQKDLSWENSSSTQITVYRNPNVHPRACILYFHGGGLLYGSRKDLPELHLKFLTEAGYVIIAYDYPLAPAAKLDTIMQHVSFCINHYILHPDFYSLPELPFFLWGRSAGAYLCLIASGHSSLAKVPNGLLSYYGYGFLCDTWFCSPNSYYCTLPKVSASCLDIASDVHTEGNLDTHYSIYVYARQTGLWKSLLYEGREKYFFLDYSLRTCGNLPCPLFCAHSTNDPDVPYSEFLALCEKYNAERFVVSCQSHDFDRSTEDGFTRQLLEKTLDFLNTHTN
nr:alpha/beta hydrolase [uncultured Sellimonas sp.]